MFKNFSFSVFTLTLLLSSPVFLSMSFSSGLRFDADPFNNLGSPSIPLSIIICSIFIFTRIKYLRVSIVDFSLLLLIVFLILLNTILGSGFRSVFVGFSMIFFIINYSFWKVFFFNVNQFSAFKGFYYGLSFILFSKLLLDVFFIGELFSKYFLTRSIVIYNYYDYFSFVYLVLFVLSLRVFFKKSFFIISLFNICHSFSFLSVSPSRLFFYGAFISAFLVFLRAFIKLKFSIVFYFSLFFIVTATLVAALFFANDVVDRSLSERFLHWSHFLQNMDVLSFVLPFTNEYRLNLTSGSLHNEFLEIFSYFGIVFFIFMDRVRKYVMDSNVLVYESVYVLVLILIIGMLVQLNITNPYITVFFSFFLAISTTKEPKVGAH